MKLARFGATICPKCGWAGATMRFCRGLMAPCPLAYTDQRGELPYHLDVKCQRCNYIWIMATKDHVEEQGQETP